MVTSSRVRVIAVVLGAFILALMAGPAVQARSCDETARIFRSLIADMHRSSEFLSYEAGPVLADYAGDSPKSCAATTIALLTRELHEPNDQIRRYAAEAIADLRVAARDAVPDLLQALKLDACVCSDAVCDKRSGSSTELIRVAMLAVNGSEGDPALYGCGLQRERKPRRRRRPAQC